jgi:molybdate transport system substrate-binding protein
MCKRISFVFIMLLLLIAPLGCSTNEKAAPMSSPSAGSQKTEIIILAAASLTDALNELKTSFEKEYPTISVTYSFGSSGKLAQQIEQGAPADIFLSASKKDMDELQNKNLIAKDYRVDFAKNELVLITNKEHPLNISSFENIDPGKVKQFAIGEPESVPVGRYTKEVFEKLKLWDKLQNSFVLGKDVRQVLTYVELGNADLGVVYASDAQISKKVKQIAMAKPEWHKPIVYPGAIIINSAQANEAKLFLNYLSGEKGKEILRKYGFN